MYRRSYFSTTEVFTEVQRIFYNCAATRTGTGGSLTFLLEERVPVKKYFTLSCFALDKNAPIIKDGSDNDEDLEWIQGIITCRIPDEKPALNYTVW